MSIRFGDHGSAEMGAGRQIPPCQWERFDLLCVHAGELALQLMGEQQVLLPPGSGVLIYPQTRFQGQVHRPVVQMTVQHFDWVEPLPPPAAVPSVCRRLLGLRNGYEVVRWQDPVHFALDARRSVQLAYLPQTAEVHELRVAQLALMLSALHPIEGKAGPGVFDPFARQVARVLEERGVGCSVAVLAEAMNESEINLRRRFRRHLSTSPRQYLLLARLREAARLLRETDWPIKTVARQVGYGDPANFHHAFQARYRTSPAVYRGRHSPRG